MPLHCTLHLSTGSFFWLPCPTLSAGLHPIWHITSSVSAHSKNRIYIYQMHSSSFSRGLALLTKKKKKKRVNTEGAYPLGLAVPRFLSCGPLPADSVCKLPYVQWGNGSWWITKSILPSSNRINTCYRNGVAWASFTETSSCLFSCFLSPTLNLNPRWAIILHVHKDQLK